MVVTIWRAQKIHRLFGMQTPAVPSAATSMITGKGNLNCNEYRSKEHDGITHCARRSKDDDLRQFVIKPENYSMVMKQH